MWNFRSVINDYIGLRLLTQKELDFRHTIDNKEKLKIQVYWRILKVMKMVIIL